ncbi:GTP cyclohydrolase-2 [Spathaspora sp. JA1]|nr:GTP cyclohydrolase-2 [Spathaspora sp. JA1]
MSIENKKIQHPQPTANHIPSSEIPDFQIPLVTPKPSSANIPIIATSKSVSPELSKEEREAIKQHLHLPDTLPVVKCIARARIPTTQGPETFLHLYENNIDNKEHLAIVFGENIRSRSLFKRREGESQQDRMTRGAYIGRLTPGRFIADRDDKLGIELKFNEDGTLIIDEQTYSDLTLVRIHSECYTGETAWSARCDCGEQFNEAGRIMGQDGHGCLVYLRQEGRGIGLGEKLKAYNLQDLGADTVQANIMLRHPADARDFSLATAILLDLGLMEIKLLTNNREKIVAVEGKHRSVKVLERIPMIPLSWQHKENGIHSTEIEGYLSTKIERMGHLLEKPLKF